MGGPVSDQVGNIENSNDGEDAELAAMQKVYSALKSLPPDGQQRVVDYVCKRLSLSSEHSRERVTGRDERRQEMAESTEIPPARDSEAIADLDSGDDSDGINPVAQKWLRRNGLSAKGLEAIFSIGGDEIDLISESVPGESKKSRMKNVVLLASAAAYLASGAARVTDDKLREALRHYDAYDGANFSHYLKGLAAEVTGSRENGYTLTPRGLAGAATLLKEVAKKPSK
jgi:hypothetical protein